MHQSPVACGAGPLWPGLQGRFEGCLVQDLTILSSDSSTTKGREFCDKEPHSDNSLASACFVIMTTLTPITFVTMHYSTDLLAAL